MPHRLVSVGEVADPPICQELMVPRDKLVPTNEKMNGPVVLEIVLGQRSTIVERLTENVNGNVLNAVVRLNTVNPVPDKESVPVGP